MKPCPFCGSEIDPHVGSRVYECTTCGATAPSVAAWEARAPTTADAEIVARMRKALATWEAQAEGARKSAGYDISRMNLLGAIDCGRDAVLLEAMAAFLRQVLDAD